MIWKRKKRSHPPGGEYSEAAAKLNIFLGVGIVNIVGLVDMADQADLVDMADIA